KDFLDERSVQFEYLKTIIRTIGDIYQIVVRHQYRMNRIVETLRRRPLNKLGARREFQIIVGSFAVSAPVPLIGTGIGVKDDDTVIEISIGHEKLIGLAIDEQARRTSE